MVVYCIIGVEMQDTEELKEVMTTLKETIPTLISGMIEAVYNAEDGESLARITARFYRELVTAGMDEDNAFQLTREFMKSRDVTNIAKEVLR